MVGVASGSEAYRNNDLRKIASRLGRPLKVHTYDDHANIGIGAPGWHRSRSSKTVYPLVVSILGSVWISYASRIFKTSSILDSTCTLMAILMSGWARSEITT